MENKIRDYKDLEIWQLAVKIIVKVYRLLRTYPKDEKYGIIAQVKDAVVSIASNIAESYGRFHYKDRIKFLYNARGSLLETENHLLISRELGFVNKTNHDLQPEILHDLTNLSVKLNNYINTIYQHI